MNSHDEGSIFPLDAQGNNAYSVLNSSSSTIKIDSLCIKLGFVKEKGDAEKCRHFSIRGYVSGMRERGSSNFLPFAEDLPPMDVPHFKYWLCQSCLQDCGNANTSHETPGVSVSDQSMIRACSRSFPPQDCGGVASLPFGEGTSGLKPVDNTKDDDDESVLPALGVNKNQPFQEIPVDTNAASEANAGLLCRKESNDGKDEEDPQQDSVVIETITGLVGPTIQSSQQNDHSKGHTRRKARKVRLLKELLCGNKEIQQREKESSNIILDPKPCSPLPASSLIKRKVPHDEDQIPVDITTPNNGCKKAMIFKGNAIAKTTMVDHQHSKDPGVSEGAPNDSKYLRNKHGTQMNSNVGKVSSDPVTAWRSIFSNMTKTDNHVTTTTTTTHVSGAFKPTYDISKDRGSGPRSNLMAPPHSEKEFSFSKKTSKNPLKSKSFGEEYSRSANVDRQSETELGLDLSLSYHPQAQLCSIPSTLNPPPTPIQDYCRRGDFFMGESSIPHRIPSDSNFKEGLVHDVSNSHAPRQVLFQEQRNYTYGSCSGHQKLDFSDAHKRINGVGGLSDVTMRPHNHQRQGKMVFMGRSDEREIVELMAKNQYERNLREARGSNNNSIPNISGLHNINMYKRTTSSHQDYLYMITPSTSEKSKMGMRNQASGFFHQEQVSDFNVFDGFQQSRNQPSNVNWMSSGPQRHHNCVPKANKKMTKNPLYTQSSKHVGEAFNTYNNGRHEKETNAFSNMSHGFSKCSEKDNQNSIMGLDLNVVAPNVIEEQTNSESLYTTSSKEHHPKNIHSLDSSYPNEAIPAMQLLSLMDAGKSNHPFKVEERKFSKPLSPCYTHCSSNMTEKTKPIPNVQLPNSRYFQSSSLGVGSSFPCGFQTGQNVKLTSSQVYYKPQEEKSRGMSSASASASVSHVFRPEESYVFPEDRSERVTLGVRIEPIGNEICTINKNPADFSSPGPENVYMINVEDLVFRGEKGRSAIENYNGPKRQKR